MSGILRWLASRWSNGTDFRYELVAAGVSEDLAYVVRAVPAKLPAWVRPDPEHCSIA